MKKFLSSFILLLGILLLGPLSVFADEREDLSLEEILQKYSIVTLGQRDNGNVALFHMTGGYLINGSVSGLMTYYTTTDAGASCSTIESEYRNAGGIMAGGRTTVCNGLDFSILYTNIVTKQAEINKGIPIEGDSTLELTPGSNYNIININDVREIVFKDIDSEANSLTVITVLDEGRITMPSVYWTDGNDEKYQFITNDNFGGSTAYIAGSVSPQTSTVNNYRFYKYTEVYRGNIVWNFPNATSISFTGVPFIGHLIAPKADVSMPESNTAGTIIANSFTAGGSSEIHRYPLQQQGLSRAINTRNETVTLDCDCEDGDTRPESVTVYLAANGNRIRSIVLNEGNNYTFNLVDLPTTLDGSEEIVYTLEGDFIEEGDVTNTDGFSLVLGCTDTQDVDDQEEPTEDTTEEPTTNSIEDKKEEKNPVTDDKVLYIISISVIALAVLLVSVLSLNNKKHEDIIRK